MEQINTLYLDEETERKQLTMEKWARSGLEILGDESMTKSLVAYEAILYYSEDYTDQLTEIEQSVDKEFVKVFSRDALETVQKIKYQNRDGRRFFAEVGQYENPDEKIRRVNLTLPIELPYGAGSVIAEATCELYESAYDSRTDRIRCKQQLIDYERHGDDVTHEVAGAILSADSDVYTVSDAYTMMVDDWYTNDDLTLEQVRDRGDQISQKNYSGRIQALQTAANNSDQFDHGDENSDEFLEFIRDAYNVGQDTAEKYAADIEITTGVPYELETSYNHLVSYLHSDIQNSIKEKIIDEYDIPEKEFADAVKTYTSDDRIPDDVKRIYESPRGSLLLPDDSDIREIESGKYEPETLLAKLETEHELLTSEDSAEHKYKAQAKAFTQLFAKLENDIEDLREFLNKGDN